MNTEVGERLRSLYTCKGGVAEVFSSKVEDYVAARPQYPAQLFQFFIGVLDVKPGALVADIGSGTGLFTRGLLEHGYRVLAVEPNAGMRTAADVAFQAYSGYASAHGSAESIPVRSSSVDLITAAQAFHWFEIDKARAEFLRVLRPGAQVALIWNDRLLADPLHKALDKVLNEFGGEKRNALVSHEGRGDLPEFFGGCIPSEFRWPHEQRLSEGGLLSLVFSRSYMPERSSSRGQEAAKKVSDVFGRFVQDGTVDVRYTAVAFVGRPSHGT
jgi:SAM-dependent methyltransferase